MDKPAKNKHQRNGKKKSKPTAVNLKTGERPHQRQDMVKPPSIKLAELIERAFQCIKNNENNFNIGSTKAISQLARTLEESVDYFVENFEGYSDTEFEGIDHRFLNHTDWCVIAVYLVCKWSDPDIPNLEGLLLKLWLGT